MSIVEIEANEASAPNTKRPTVLFICHNHPAVRPGGAEAYALELHRHLRRIRRVRVDLPGQGGPAASTGGRTASRDLRGSGRTVRRTSTSSTHEDWTTTTGRSERSGTTRSSTRSISRASSRRSGPMSSISSTRCSSVTTCFARSGTRFRDAPIVYTLHEFMPICHRQGQMLRVPDDEPCTEESPRRCHECFPEISPQTFFLRKRFVQSHLALVDLFIAPSAHSCASGTSTGDFRPTRSWSRSMDGRRLPERRRWRSASTATALASSDS